MKELTIEQKAQRYNEAFRIAQELYNNSNSSSVGKGYVCTVFPELKESEDERIKKALIDYFDDANKADENPLQSYGIHTDKAIAWLEKQGEHLENYDEAEKEKVDFVGDGFIKCFANFLDFKEGNIYWLEYMGDDKYNVRSDNLLGKTYHITPCQLYTVFKKLTWLEKQGTSYTKRDVDDAYLKGITDTKNEIEKQYEANYQIRKDIATFIFNYRGDIKDRAKWMDYLGINVSFVELQGEQKPAIIIPKFRVGDEIKATNEAPLTITKITDSGYWSEDLFICSFENSTKWELVGKFIDKVEPKFNFKVGQYIVATGECVYLITKIDGFNVTLVDTNGDEYVFDASSLDDAHEWTIQNAKAGDILCTYECGEPKIVFILKGTPKKHYALSYYCYYNIMYPHFASDSEKGCLAPNDEDVKPATKEQRDLLFKNMEKSGYEFDFETKELKEIEDEKYNGEDYGIDSLYHAKRILEKTLGSVDGYQSDDGILEHKCAITAVKKLYEQKPTWSEEDENRINRLIAYFEDKESFNAEDDIVYANWLKSLRPQKQWKPSKEQMEALWNVYEGGEKQSALASLYNDLKKL